MISTYSIVSNFQIHRRPGIPASRVTSSLTYLWRQFENIAFDSSQDVRLDHFVQLADLSVGEIILLVPDFKSVTVTVGDQLRSSSPQTCSAKCSLEFVRIEKAEQIEQFSNVVVQGRSGQKEAVDGVELSQVVPDE